MRKIFLALAAVAIIFACDKEKGQADDAPGGGGSGGSGGGGGGGDEPPSELVIECTTDDATDITFNSATLSGMLSSEDYSIAQLQKNGDVYFEISTSEELSPDDATIPLLPADLEMDGSFSAEVSSLAENTTYYFRACYVYVDLEHEKEGMVNGEIKSFTTLEMPKDPSVTGEVEELTEISAVIASYANPTPQMTGVTFGLVYNDWGYPSPVGAYDISVEAEETDEDGKYTVSLTGLQPGHTYYYRSWLRAQDSGYETGDVLSFQTPEIQAEVQMTGVSDVSEYQATLHGKLILNTLAEFEPSVYFNVRGASNPYVAAQLQEDGTFSGVATELMPGAPYYVRAYAIVGGKEFKSDELTISTTAIEGTTELLPVTNLTEFGATISARFTSECSPAITREASFFWIDKAPQTMEDWTYFMVDGGMMEASSYLRVYGNKVPATLGADGTFSADLTNLTYNKDYTCVACVTLAGYYDCRSEIDIFHTPDIVVDVTTGAAAGISETAATLNGNITVQSVTPFSKEIWFKYRRGDNISRETLISSGTRLDAGSGPDADGNFSGTLSNLEPGKKYYYIAGAKVHDKEVYGEVQSFTTLDITGSVSLLEPQNLLETTATLRGRMDNIQGGESYTRTARFFYYEYNTNLEAYGKSADATIAADGTFSADVSNLLPDKTYYCLAKLTIGPKSFYSEVGTFKTLNVIVEAFAPTNIKEKSATFTAQMTMAGPDDPSKRAEIEVRYAYNNYKADATIGADGFISGICGNLKPVTQYTYQMIVYVRDWAYYSNSVTFTTADLQASVETLPVTDIHYTYANFHGRLTLGDTDATDIQKYFLFGKTGTPESEWERVDATLQPDGTYAAKPTYVEPASTYSCKFAVSAFYPVRTVVGEAVSFTTETPPSRVPDGALSLWTFATRDDGSQYEIFWADRNIGAESPDGYGNYYSWGEIETKEDYDMQTGNYTSHYKWYNWNSDYGLYMITKYAASTTSNKNPDDKLELDLEDDVANVTLYGEWRIPYLREWAALQDCCNLTWKELGEGKTVIEFRSKSASRTAVLLLPIAGYKSYKSVTAAGSYGCYWARTVDTSNDWEAHEAKFTYSSYYQTINMQLHSEYRFIGNPIRAVIE